MKSALPLISLLLIVSSLSAQSRFNDRSKPAGQGLVGERAGDSPQDLIRRFVEKETEFRELWGQYTYTQNVWFEVLGPGDVVRERRHMVIEIYFTQDGKRQTRVVSDRGRLTSVQVTPEDIQNAIELQPFVLTKDDLPDYKVEYAGKERVDELDTYVFEIRPRKIKKGNRYFKGRVWVDRIDLQIVMTNGKVVPETRNNQFPKFETVREQIDGDFWFPTWSEGNDFLRFGRKVVHIRQLVTFENFRKFGVTSSIEFGPVPDRESTPRPPK